MAAIAGLGHDNEIYGFTKGQFSLLQLLQAVFLITGPAHLSLSTWTAASNEIEALAAMRARGDMVGHPAADRLQHGTPGARDDRADAREARAGQHPRCQTHSKFAVFQNAEWKVVLRSSMNLNMNPRNEDFTLPTIRSWPPS